MTDEEMKELNAKQLKDGYTQEYINIRLEQIDNV